jgi:hypothetical protein
VVIFSDYAYGLRIDPGTFAGIGDLSWTGNPWASGWVSVVSHGGLNGNGIDLSDFTMEGNWAVNPSTPVLMIGPQGAALSHYRLDNVTLADVPSTTHLVVNQAVPEDQLLVEHIPGQNYWDGTIQGPATVIGASRYFGGGSHMTHSPTVKSQPGFYRSPGAGNPSKVIGRVEQYVRALSPSVVRFSNLAYTNSTNWYNSAVTITPVLSPDGTNDAYNLSGNGYVSVNGYPSLGLLAVGDTYIATAMVRATSGYGCYAAR